MRNLALTDKEKGFLDVLGQIGCFSKKQAYEIMHKYYDFYNESGMNYSLYKMKAARQLFFEDDSDFIISGNPKAPKHGELKLERIWAVDYAIDHIDNTRDFQSIMRFSDAANVTVYVSDGECYEVVPVTLSRPGEIGMAKQRHDESIRRMGAKMGEFTTVFMFPPSDDEDEVLDAMSETDIDMPMVICCVTDGDIKDKIQYREYAEE